MARGGIELLLGVALGYLAFTEEGRVMGNKMADAAVKGGKAMLQNYVKKGISGVPVQTQKEEKHEDH
ncbi:MAG: hypothetical protein E7579_04315 [Ruminococcaceae bacterium]|nr:hypothetical protein [Oscillospiraceae bacterium]